VIEPEIISIILKNHQLNKITTLNNNKHKHNLMTQKHKIQHKHKLIKMTILLMLTWSIIKIKPSHKVINKFHHKNHKKLKLVSHLIWQILSSIIN